MEEFVDRSLINLGVESIDLVQLHCPLVKKFPIKKFTKLWIILLLKVKYKIMV